MKDEDRSLKREVAKFFDKDHVIKKRKHPPWMDKVYYPLFKGRVLEIGFGMLLPPQHLRKNYVGVELSKHALMYAKANNVDCVCADGEKLPFKNKSFETVVCHDVLPYFPNPQNFLAEAKRVSNNRIIIIDANYILDKRRLSEMSLRDVVKLLREFITKPKCYRRAGDIWRHVKNGGAITGVNLRFVEYWMKRVGCEIILSTSFMYNFISYYILLQKSLKNFIKLTVSRLPLFRFLGPMMFIIAKVESITKQNTYA